MNLHPEAIHLLRWLHFVAAAVGGGAAVVALLLSGFEDGREDLRGLAATVWAKVVSWSFRLAVIAGAVLLVLLLQRGENPFVEGRYFTIKLLLVLGLLGLSETAPKALGKGKRGAGLLALTLFLAISFVVYNRNLFGHAPIPAPLPAPVAASAPAH
jgi:lysylphosphatidylglycerol synthetase-like protein (DUF2156 family)